LIFFFFKSNVTFYSKILFFQIKSNILLKNITNGLHKVILLMFHE